jgi:hypothetical protein
VNPLNPGDLLVAAIVTGGGAVRPPPGWAPVPNADHAGQRERLQVFYRIPIPLARPNGGGAFGYTFTASAAQAMTGALTDFEGVSQTRPISASAGQINATSSTAVAAPSLTPTSANSVLVFIGATAASERWTAPHGMKSNWVFPGELSAFGGPAPTFPYPPSDIDVAFERWPHTFATGGRVAAVSAASESVGEEIALDYPAPTTCPKVAILAPRTRLSFYGRPHRGPILKVGRDGLVSVRMKCKWTAPCVGAMGVFDERLLGLAESDFRVPAGQTRTVQIAACNLRSVCKNTSRKLAQAELRPGARIPVFVQILAQLSNGQLVPADVGHTSPGLLEVVR